MSYDEGRIDEAVLALLYLTSFQEHGITRAWKNFDWEATNRLFERGLIDNPRNRNKSIVFTPEGIARAKGAYEKLFGSDDRSNEPAAV